MGLHGKQHLEHWWTPCKPWPLTRCPTRALPVALPRATRHHGSISTQLFAVHAARQGCSKGTALCPSICTVTQSGAGTRPCQAVLQEDYHHSPQSRAGGTCRRPQPAARTGRPPGSLHSISTCSHLTVIVFLWQITRFSCLLLPEFLSMSFFFHVLICF